MIKKLPIKWKLTIWSSVLLSVLFISYNLLQYIVIEKWSVSYEQQNMQHQLTEIKAFLEEKSIQTSSQLRRYQSYFATINEKNQLFRILDKKGKPILTVSRAVPSSWVKPKNTTSPQYEIVHHGEERLLILRSPLTIFPGTIEIVRNMETFDHFRDTIFLVMIATGAGAIILSLLGGTIIAKQLLVNVQAMTNTVQKIKTNGLNERVPINDTNDELAQLGKLFNDLMDDLEQAFLQQKQFVEDASHELRTPLTIIKGHLTMLNRWGKHDPDVLNKSLQSSLKEVERLIHLVNELLQLSRAEAETVEAAEAVDVCAVLDSVVRNFSSVYEDYTFRQICRERVHIPITVLHLEQIFIILLDNAVKYSRESRKEIHLFVYAENGKANIVIQDFGIGIPQEDIPYVFHRFYRVDKARSRKQGGNGLGLSIAKRLVEKYEGTISIESKEGEGTKVVVIFPIKEKQR
ncbi:HAMP domain-containing sensor histidine kinase [Anoxybacteroides amylolyticum]|uniref:Signal transduction histidine-protein kinase ArlS n=1 Tax=Anoxybacteroides amylolyticum TaxID=294699 RepID=A0A160F322_9BACL|nr:HAMP domain-containing histidine kinase [Anoxybacillus amylolyticus]ANB59943.1 HAMP domain protein [Anoxybacillus amylolyticus]